MAKEGGGSLSMPVANQVRETFVAALATTAAAETVGSGQLTRALSYAGFGDVDLSEATAAPAPARRPALRVIKGEGQGSGRGKGRATEPEPEPEEPAEPDPALLKRLAEAEKRSRETMSAAAKAGDALSEATDALETWTPGSPSWTPSSRRPAANATAWSRPSGRRPRPTRSPTVPCAPRWPRSTRSARSCPTPTTTERSIGSGRRRSEFRPLSPGTAGGGNRNGPAYLVGMPGRHRT